MSVRKLGAFIQVSLDGYFADPNGDLSFAHKDPGDAEWNAFVEGNAKGGGALIFGRITYEMMASYWPTPMAAKQNPAVAERMNAMPKIVFSLRLDEVSWANTTLVKGDPVAEMRKLKDAAGPDMTILGSGSIVARLLEHKLIDGLQIVVCPLVLGHGKRLFDGVNRRLDLTLTGTRAFGNGSVLLCYAPA
ncbi:MAG: dihydrofolate reductase family protein [Pseudorhodoplanes sp.]|nr:dihydrofolate reductase family protein [Pseudorhodoplanes sp.]